jgi:hypothetical protein
MRIIALSTKGGDRDVSGSCPRASPQPRKELREFYSHLVTYLVICTPLVIVDLANEDPTNSEVSSD